MESPESEPPDPGRVWHRILDAAEAVLWLGLLIAGGAVGYTILRTDAPSSSDAQIAPLPPGLVEAEALQILGRSREFTFWLQPTDGFRGGRWSGDGHMLALGAQQGDWIDLEFPPTDRGPHRLELFLTRAMDYGIVAVFVNGEQVGEEVDLWSDVGVVPTGAVEMGVVELRGEGDVLRLVVTGRHPQASAPFFQFGLDGLRLTKP